MDEHYLSVYLRYVNIDFIPMFDYSTLSAFFNIEFWSTVKKFDFFAKLVSHQWVKLAIKS